MRVNSNPRPSLGENPDGQESIFSIRYLHHLFLFLCLPGCSLDWAGMFEAFRFPRRASTSTSAVSSLVGGSTCCSFLSTARPPNQPPCIASRHSGTSCRPSAKTSSSPPSQQLESALQTYRCARTASISSYAAALAYGILEAGCRYLAT